MTFKTRIHQESPTTESSLYVKESTRIWEPKEVAALNWFLSNKTIVKMALTNPNKILLEKEIYVYEDVYPILATSEWFVPVGSGYLIMKIKNPKRAKYYLIEYAHEVSILFYLNPWLDYEL